MFFGGALDVGAERADLSTTIDVPLLLPDSEVGVGRFEEERADISTPLSLVSVCVPCSEGLGDAGVFPEPTLVERERCGPDDSEEKRTDLSAPLPGLLFLEVAPGDIAYFEGKWAEFSEQIPTFLRFESVPDVVVEADVPCDSTDEGRAMGGVGLLITPLTALFWTSIPAFGASPALND